MKPPSCVPLHSVPFNLEKKPRSGSLASASLACMPAHQSHAAAKFTCTQYHCKPCHKHMSSSRRCPFSRSLPALLSRHASPCPSSSSPFTLTPGI
eukprot:6207745-Pleurochrysis_carterae.AAC.1